MYIGLRNIKKNQMTNEENEVAKMSRNVSDDGKHGFIFNETTEKLFARISFYDTGYDLSIEEKKQLLDKIITNTFEIVEYSEETRKNNSWNTRCEAFQEAYQYEQKEQGQITWLMTTILGLTKEEAARRWEIAKDLMTHDDFKDKEDIVMNRVYLNKSHLKDSELENVQYIRTR
jgi:predicted Ser/Thr protein kinase